MDTCRCQFCVLWGVWSCTGEGGVWCVCVCVRYRTYIMAHLRLGNLVIDQQRTYHKVWQVLLVDGHWLIILYLVRVLSLFVSLVNVS